MRQIFLDTETTGREAASHRIIEIAALEMSDRQLTGRHFHYYLDPERDIDPGAQAVHGLTRDFLRGKPKFSEIVLEFLDFVRGGELIIHNASFDLGFIHHEIQRLANPSLPSDLRNCCAVLDTLKIARARYFGQKNSLDALCTRLGVDRSRRQYHGALLDAELLASVYLKMTGGQVELFSEARQTAQGAGSEMQAPKRPEGLVLE